MDKFDDICRIASLSNTLRADPARGLRHFESRIASLSNTLGADPARGLRHFESRIASLSNTLRADPARGLRRFESRIASLSNTLRADNQTLQWQAYQFAAASRSLGEIQRQVSQTVSARLSCLSDTARTVESSPRRLRNCPPRSFGGAVEFLPDQNVNERDAAAIHAGLKPEPPAAYSDEVFTEGFSFCITPMAAPKAVESGDLGATLDPMHWKMLTELERRLRHVVEEELTKLDGPHWIKRRVPQSMRLRWKDRQEEDRTAGRPVYTDIQYSDFMDIADIVGRSNNWREAFQPIFSNKEDFITSFRRLHPVRNAIAHGRPLGRADVLTLAAEAARIFGVLGIRVLN